MSYNIDRETILKAAIAKFGSSVEVSEPYWVDGKRVRVGILLNGNLSFGADFFYREGKFV